MPHQPVEVLCHGLLGLAQPPEEGAALADDGGDRDHVEPVGKGGGHRNVRLVLLCSEGAVLALGRGEATSIKQVWLWMRVSRSDNKQH